MEVLCFLPSTHYPLYDFDLRATHARTLLPAALASVSFGFVLVRVKYKKGVFFGVRRTPRDNWDKTRLQSPIVLIALRKRTLSPVRLVLKVTYFFSVAICHSGVSLYFWGVLTRLDQRHRAQSNEIESTVVHNEERSQDFRKGDYTIDDPLSLRLRAEGRTRKTDRFLLSTLPRAVLWKNCIESYCLL